MPQKHPEPLNPQTKKHRGNQGPKPETVKPTTPNPEPESLNLQTLNPKSYDSTRFLRSPCETLPPREEPLKGTLPWNPIVPLKGTLLWNPTVPLKGTLFQNRTREPYSALKGNPIREPYSIDWYPFKRTLL